MAGIGWSGLQADKLYCQDGFLSTLLHSLAVTAVEVNPMGCESDGTDTIWAGPAGDKIYINSGPSDSVESTMKTSISVSLIDGGGRNCGIGGTTSTPWCGLDADKLYVLSGAMSSVTTTMKDSVGILGVDASVTSHKWDDTSHPWAGQSGDKLYLQSGSVTTVESTMKTSLSVTAVETEPRGNTLDANGDTVWIGGNGDKLYLTSGQFTSTLKTSRSVASVDNIPWGCGVILLVAADTTPENLMLRRTYNPLIGR